MVSMSLLKTIMEQTVTQRALKSANYQVLIYLLYVECFYSGHTRNHICTVVIMVCQNRRAGLERPIPFCGPNYSKMCFP
jgi:catabolite regulation protein CreA